MIDRLSTLVPSNTFLDELEVEANAVHLVGRSEQASALIGILEAEPDLSGARFAAPVTREADGRDHFDIVVSRALPLEASP